MLQIVSLFFWLILIPFCVGLLPVNFISPRKRNPAFVFLAGYFFMWALFEVVCIPVVLWVKYDNFSVASDLFTALIMLCAAAGIFLLYQNGKAGKDSLIIGKRKELKERQNAQRKAVRRSRETADPADEAWRTVNRSYKIEWLLFLGLVGFQLYKAAAYASFDGDDAYYVVESLIAQQADVMYKILPYTGRPTDIDVRHALAVFPMWVAFIAVKCDIHATIVSHSILPMVLIPLTYLVYYEIGKKMFSCKPDGEGENGTGEIGSRENLPVFMIIMALFQMFGNVSIYTNETFFLTRTWQGKAVAGSLVIPAVLWLLLCIYDRMRKKERVDAGLWILFVCVNMTAGICSSIAIFLVSILIALTAFVLMLAERDFKVLLKFGAACIPNLAYMGIYVVIGYSYLLK